jgi:hypothetical protein
MEKILVVYCSMDNICYGSFILTYICRSNTNILPAEQYWPNVGSFVDTSIFLHVRVSWILVFFDTKFILRKSDE